MGEERDDVLVLYGKNSDKLYQKEITENNVEQVMFYNYVLHN